MLSEALLFIPLRMGNTILFFTSCTRLMNTLIRETYRPHNIQRNEIVYYTVLSVSLLTFTLRMINRPTSISFYCLLISFDLSLFNFSIHIRWSKRNFFDFIFKMSNNSYSKNISLEKSV